MDARSNTLPPNCAWPACAETNDNCHIGLSMPCTIIHPPFDGENLARANRPFPIYPNNVLQLVVTAALIGLAGLVICAFEKGVLV